jgi:SPP1 gp7 family putative phage head morphogenesis protein
MIVNFEELNLIINKNVKSVEKALYKNYKIALKSVNSELNNFFMKYSDIDGVIKPSEIHKYNRITQLRKNIIQKLKDNNKLTKEELNKLVENCFTEAHKETFRKIQNQLEKNYAYMPPNDLIIKASTQNKIGLMTLNQRLAKAGTEIRRTITKEITQGLINGESYIKIAKRIQGKLDGDFKKARLVARTESHRNQMNGRLASITNLQNLGVKMKKQWLSAIDERTRESHILLNGQIREIKENFDGKFGSGLSPGNLGHPAEDCNCRCDMITIIEE